MKRVGTGRARNRKIKVGAVMKYEDKVSIIAVIINAILLCVIKFMAGIGGMVVLALGELLMLIMAELINDSRNWADIQREKPKDD